MKQFTFLFMASVIALVSCNSGPTGVGTDNETLEPSEQSEGSIDANTSDDSYPSSTKESCVGDVNCINQVRKLVNGAGWEIANEEYAGEGTFYISAFQYGPGEPISMTYVMDCNCEPVDLNLHNSRSNSSSENLHRCGRRWNGSTKYLDGQWGDYCSVECYAELYPN